MSDREPVTHYVDEDWGPLCRFGQEGDSMWAFIDDQITCPGCRTMILDQNSIDRPFDPLDCLKAVEIMTRPGDGQCEDVNVVHSVVKSWLNRLAEVAPDPSLYGRIVCVPDTWRASVEMRP